MGERVVVGAVVDHDRLEVAVALRLQALEHLVELLATFQLGTTTETRGASAIADLLVSDGDCRRHPLTATAPEHEPGSRAKKRARLATWRRRARLRSTEAPLLLALAYPWRRTISGRSDLHPAPVQRRQKSASSM